MNKIFWSVAALEAVFLVIAFVMTATEKGVHNDGGRGMALVFLITLPLVVLVIASFIYWRTSSPVVHGVLLVAILIPMAMLIGQKVRSAGWSSDAAAGNFIYEDPKMAQFVAAVSDLDTKKVRELAPGVDVNAPGTDAWTPLRWAVNKGVDAGDKLEPIAGRVEMVRLLLSLGAKPDPALPDACRANRGAFTDVILAAGANPNYKEVDGTPAFFSGLKYARSGEVESLRLLGAKGTDFNALDAKGEGALLMAAIYSKWDSALFLLEQGVKRDPAAVEAVKKALEDRKLYKQEIPPALQQLAAKLQSE